jgi:hypothetical protein
MDPYRQRELEAGKSKDAHGQHGSLIEVNEGSIQKSAQFRALTRRRILASSGAAF